MRKCTFLFFREIEFINNFPTGMMNNDIHPVPDEASRRAQQRQEEFNRMEARLRQMDYHMNERSPARQFLQNQI